MDNANDQQSIKDAKLVITVVFGILILLFTLFISYRQSKSQPSGPIFPAGVTYLGPSPTSTK